MSKECYTCKHWNEKGRYGSLCGEEEGPLNQSNCEYAYGSCRKIEDRVDISTDPGAELEIEIDGNFGCNLWEAKEGVAKENQA